MLAAHRVLPACEMSTVGRANAPRAEGHESWRELWLRTAVRGALIVTVYFGLWELAERFLEMGLCVHGGGLEG